MSKDKNEKKNALNNLHKYNIASHIIETREGKSAITPYLYYTCKGT